MNEIYLCSQIQKEVKPDIRVYLKDGRQVDASDIILSSDGQVISVTGSDGSEYVAEAVDLCQNFLEVPGVGFLKPGTLVRIKGQEYELNFGEHVNISNQHLISWYITPVNVSTQVDPLGRPCSENRTLYMGMINDIDLVTV